jgi:mannose-1-phosphate guanylyltransferase/mannose-1-phosphate guanylyltransferase/mannose-6-phosphate isomerase
MTSEAIRFTVAEQIQAAGIQSSAIVLEPEARGTALAIAAATLLIQEKDPDALILVAPCDHVIADHAAFLGALEIGAAAAEQEFLVTFSVMPSRPETGYGYIRQGESIGPAAVYRVAEFVEKPSRPAAEAMIAAGGHLWNSGMFLFKAAQFLSELERHAPEIRSVAAAAFIGSKATPDFLRLDAQAFATGPMASIDVAVMERTDRAATVPVDIGWSDVGTWSELWRVSPKDPAGNACRGDVVLRDTSNCLVISEGKLTTLNGVRDLSVVVTDDAIMISGHDAAQQTKEIVNELRWAAINIQSKSWSEYG